MDFSKFGKWLGDAASYLPEILGAIGILIVGWIAAAIVRKLVRKGLGKLSLNDRFSGQAKSAMDIEKIISVVVFWIVMLFALVAAFNILDLDAVATPLSSLASAVMLYLPRILLAGALAVIAWLIATLAKKGVGMALDATELDKKLAVDDPKAIPLSQTLGEVVFWLIILLFLPAIVGALEMGGLLEPLTSMVDKMLGYAPQIMAALFIGGIGYLIAKVLRNVVTSLLTVSNVDRLTQGKDGKGGVKLSQLCGTLVFIVVLVPALIAALQALDIAVIADPAEHMLQMFMSAIPNIIAAAIIVFVAWFVGRFVAQMLTQLLSELGFDRMPAHLGFDLNKTQSNGKSASPSQVVGGIVLFFVMAFAVVEAANRLGFGGINELFEQLIGFASQILFGLIILAVGQWLAGLAARAIQSTSSQHATGMARIARVAILGLVVAMGLNAMGFADSIVNLAFGLTLGAIAVAVALAFGLGGRDAAGRLTRHWVDGYLGNKKD